MAAVAKFGLRLDQQLALFLGVMRAVAVEAANIVPRVSGRAKTLLLVGLAMAFQTAPARFRPRQIRETDDLGFVAAARHVLGAGTVAGFTAVAILLEGLKMGRSFKLLSVNVLVTSQANVGAGILRRIGRITVLFLFVGCPCGC